MNYSNMISRIFPLPVLVPYGPPAEEARFGNQPLDSETTIRKPGSPIRKPRFGNQGPRFGNHRFPETSRPGNQQIAVGRPALALCLEFGFLWLGFG